MERVALILARFVAEREYTSRGAARRRLSAPDRVPYFEPGLALTIATGMVRTDGRHTLRRGHFEPNPFAEERPPHCRTCTCSDAPLS